jgi:two-component system NtrC family sensor kinase
LNRVLRAAIRCCTTDAFPKFAREADAELDSLAERLSQGLSAFVEVPHGAESELLPRLLRATARARSRSAQSWIAPLEERIDHLVGQLAEARLDFDHRLRGAKLEALAEFAAGASHEFNNPLAVISGNAQWLKAREADPDKAGHLGTIIRQTQRIHDLLTGTRQFSSPSAAKPGVHSVEALLGRVQRDSQSEADALGIRIEFASDPSVFLHADAEQTRTALSHLVRNALEAAGQGGRIKLTSATEGSAVAISVEDSGTGVAEDAQEHLFDPFFSGRSAGRGRGLGLPIAWALARNNGGDVRWDAAHPSRFTLSLPLREVPSRQVA